MSEELNLTPAAETAAPEAPAAPAAQPEAEAPKAEE